MRTLSPKALAASHTLGVDLVTAQVGREFDGAGLSFVLLKGPSFSRWLYGDSGICWYVDTDLLIGGEGLEAAQTLLAKLGFHTYSPPEIPGDRPRHNVSYLRNEDGASVELHWTLVGLEALHDRVWKALSSRTEAI